MKWHWDQVFPRGLGAIGFPKNSGDGLEVRVALGNPKFGPGGIMALWGGAKLLGPRARLKKRAHGAHLGEAFKRRKIGGGPGAPWVFPVKKGVGAFLLI